MTTVAVVDGDEGTRRRFVRLLQAAQFEVQEAADGVEALRSAFRERPDVAIVDLNTGGVEAYELIRLLQAACEIPILATAEQLTTEQAVRALDIGADDAFDKDCNPSELVARVRSAIRRRDRKSEPERAKQIVTGSLVIDRVEQRVSKRGEVVSLTRTEYRLLDALASKVGQVVPRRELLSTVWGEEYVDETRYLRVYVAYLRAKIEDDPSNPRYLMNEWGTGYRLALLPSEAQLSLVTTTSARSDAEASAG